MRPVLCIKFFKSFDTVSLVTQMASGLYNCTRATYSTVMGHWLTQIHKEVVMYFGSRLLHTSTVYVESTRHFQCLHFLKWSIAFCSSFFIALKTVLQYTCSDCCQPCKIIVCHWKWWKSTDAVVVLLWFWHCYISVKTYLLNYLG